MLDFTKIRTLMILTATTSYLKRSGCSAYTFLSTKVSSSEFASASSTFRTMATATTSQGDAADDYEFTDDERYLFDTFGFLIVRGVLSEEEVRIANAAIDKNMDGIQERTDPALRNTKKNTAFSGNGKRGRMDLGGILEWGEDSHVFKSILAHPKLVPKFHALVGKGYRMDHNPFAIVQDQVSYEFCFNSLIH